LEKENDISETKRKGKGGFFISIIIGSILTYFIIDLIEDIKKRRSRVSLVKVY